MVADILKLKKSDSAALQKSSPDGFCAAIGSDISCRHGGSPGRLAGRCAAKVYSAVRSRSGVRLLFRVFGGVWSKGDAGQRFAVVE